MSDTALVIMARYPERGKVKTRLARFLGEDETLLLYHAFLQDLAQRFSNWTYDLHWAYTPAVHEHVFSSLIASLIAEQDPSMYVFPQLGEDFGTRLYQAFMKMHEMLYSRVILIGSDSPQISRATVQRAYEALDIADVVLGPAEDGGYYLLAMRQPYDVFSGIPMSTDVVLDMTIARAQAQHLSVYLLEPLFDVDTQHELARLSVLLQHNSFLAPCTATYLSTLLPTYSSFTVRKEHVE
jgi:uncharacterized protein